MQHLVIVAYISSYLRVVICVNGSCKNIQIFKYIVKS